MAGAVTEVEVEEGVRSHGEGGGVGRRWHREGDGVVKLDVLT